MRLLICCVVLAWVSICVSATAAELAIQLKPPATQEEKATSPTTKPAVSAAELGRMLKALKDEKAQLAKVAHISLTRSPTEKPADFALFSDSGAPTYYTLLKRLHDAAVDKELVGVLVTIGIDEIPLSQAQELRDALNECSKAGKATFAYADQYGTGTYIFASGAQHVCLLPGGEVMIPGVSVETMFARGLLDKIGVQPDLIQIGEYKGASESFMRGDASPELRGELDRLVDSLYGRLVTSISERRGISERAVKSIIDRAWLPAAEARDAKLIDNLVDINGLRDLIEQELHKKIDLVADYGATKDDAVDFTSPFALLQLLSRKPAEVEEPCVALVYVDGMIVEGGGGDGLLGDAGVNEASLRKAMRSAARDEDVKAIVIRIDSPGGSALASEAIWQAVRRAAAGKPVVVSIGGMAASGGYYVASAADRIFADNSSIVGSIGVVGGKVSLAGLYQKVGIASETFSRGANAGMFSSSSPFTDSQRKMIGNLMRQTYDQFVDRILQTRKKKIADIDKVARGRIFTAEAAVSLGLVDEIGGLEKALGYAATAGKLGKDYPVKVLPAPKSLADIISGGPDAVSPVRTMGAALPLEFWALPAGLRQLMVLQTNAMRQLEISPVLLVPPVMMRVH